MLIPGRTQPAFSLTAGGIAMCLKWWDNGACIAYGKALPVVKVGIPAALVTTFRADGSFGNGIATAGDAAVRVGPPRP